ncbi:hypothetical protein BVX97_02010 [bacterium E08(2017)]|nr:hypothetical protein BVX97_02010 [bacterium E08(2017)]
MGKLGKQYVIPILVIVVGIGWLLNVQGIIPKVDWVWTCSLAAIGILTLAVYKLDKLTAVVGPFMILASLLSILRQTDKLSLEKEVPLLTIALGILLLIAHVINLPNPEVLTGDDEDEDKEQDSE